MSQIVTPELERIFSQLLWLNHRCTRIQESVSAHFGKALVDRVLKDQNLPDSPLANNPNIYQLLDEKDPQDFLQNLGFLMESYEAKVITALRKHASIYQQHVDEQILFGARTAGQESGRDFLARSKPAIKGRSHLDIPESVQAVFELTYHGSLNEKHIFLSIRPLGSSSVHFSQSPHMDAWKIVKADPKFMYSVKCEWIRGILDILSPKIEFTPSLAIEKGDPYGLAHFHERGVHAGP